MSDDWLDSVRWNDDGIAPAIERVLNREDDVIKTVITPS